MSNLYLRLAKTNIRNNRQLYLPYLISGIVTVAMFYLMIFINNNPGMKTIPGAANLKMIMSMGVGIIAIFACISSSIPTVLLSKTEKKKLVCTISLEWKNDISQKYWDRKHFLWQ